MNDASEVVLLAPKLQAIAGPRVVQVLADWMKADNGRRKFIESRGGVEQAAAAELRKMIEVLYRVTFGVEREHKFLQPYCTCFCHHDKDTYERENGLLSQWRSYGRDAGYAVVFNVK